MCPEVKGRSCAGIILRKPCIWFDSFCEGGALACALRWKGAALQVQCYGSQEPCIGMHGAHWGERAQPWHNTTKAESQVYIRTAHLTPFLISPLGPGGGCIMQGWSWELPPLSAHCFPCAACCILLGSWANIKAVAWSSSSNSPYIIPALHIMYTELIQIHRNLGTIACIALGCSFILMCCMVVRY